MTASDQSRLTEEMEQETTVLDDLLLETMLILQWI
jgi:hypothetical protein